MHVADTLKEPSSSVGQTGLTEGRKRKKRKGVAGGEIQRGNQIIVESVQYITTI